MHDTLPLLLSAVVMAGMLAQWAAWRLKLPSILFLLMIGLVVGPLTGLLNPDEVFGDLLFSLVSLGVALVLFEGALTLKFSDLSGHGPSVSNMVTWGALLKWLLISVGAFVFIDFGWDLALLFGALVVVTGPTVIMPLLRTVKPSPGVSNILRWEGILIDPIGALLAVIVYELIISEARGGDYWLFFREIFTGSVFGIGGALLLTPLLRHHWLPEYLHNVFTLALVLLVFSVANLFAEESGLLAVTVMGIWLANTPRLDMEDILTFKESLSVLIVSVLFIVLAARIDLGLIAATGWGAIGVLLAIFLARPAMVFVSTWRSGLKWQEKVLISWIGPRGIVAAAVSSLFALKLEAIGYQQAELLPALTFLVIIVTVLLQSLTSRRLAKDLGIAEDDARGVLLVGANPLAVAIGKALREKGFRVTLTSSTWSEVQNARMAGLGSYFGNPVSSHADRHLDLVGFGMLLAVSTLPALNALACVRYRSEFGKNRVYNLRNVEEKDNADNSRMVEGQHVSLLFGEDVSVQKLLSLIAEGAEIKLTKLSEAFDLDAYKALYGDGQLFLFAIDSKGYLRPFTAQSKPPLKNGWTVVSLIPRPVLEAVLKQNAESRRQEKQEKQEKVAAKPARPEGQPGKQN